MQIFVPKWVNNKRPKFSMQIFVPKRVNNVYKITSGLGRVGEGEAITKQSRV